MPNKTTKVEIDENGRVVGYSNMSETAKRFGITRQRLEMLVRDDRVPYLRIGDRVYINDKMDKKDIRPSYRRKTNSNTRNMERLLFRKRLHELVIEKGKTYYQISQETGISVSTLQRYKSLGCIPRMYDTIKSLCNYFNVSEDYLLGREENV